MGLVVAEALLIGAARRRAGHRRQPWAHLGSEPTRPGQTLLGIAHLELRARWWPLLGFGVALFLGFAAGFVPAWGAYRARITDMLRNAVAWRCRSPTTSATSACAGRSTLLADRRHRPRGGGLRGAHVDVAGLRGRAAGDRPRRTTRSSCSRGSNSEVTSRRARSSSERNPRSSSTSASRGPDGQPLASWEWVVVMALPRQSDGQRTNVVLRAVTPQALRGAGGIHLIAGRHFTPGLDEVIVGRRILDAHPGPRARRHRQVPAQAASRSSASSSRRAPPSRARSGATTTRSARLPARRRLATRWWSA